MPVQESINTRRFCSSFNSIFAADKAGRKFRLKLSSFNRNALSNLSTSSHRWMSELEISTAVMAANESVVWQIQIPRAREHHQDRGIEVQSHYQSMTHQSNPTTQTLADQAAHTVDWYHPSHKTETQRPFHWSQGWNFQLQLYWALKEVMG